MFRRIYTRFHCCLPPALSCPSPSSHSGIPQASLCVSLLSRSRSIHVSACCRSNESGAGKGVHEYATNAHFGFQNVEEGERQEMVNDVFHRVADKYDLMNDLMSGGVHRLWKDEFVRRLKPVAGNTYVDMAGGTGDISFRIIEALRQQHGSRVQPPVPVVRPSSVLVCDINADMLAVGKQRAMKRNYLNLPEIHVDFIETNAESLPESIGSETVDAYTIAFGIRNCTHIDKVIREAYRVLKPGGVFMCLEFSHVPNFFLRSAYDAFSLNVIPTLGSLFGDKDSYQYLVESIRRFPAQEEFATLIRAEGFKAVSYTNLSLGISAIHSGFKL